MAQRSRRNRIRYQVEKAILKCDQIAGHLKYLDELSEGKSDVINVYISGLVEGIELYKTTLVKFREDL